MQHDPIVCIVAGSSGSTYCLFVLLSCSVLQAALQQLASCMWLRAIGYSSTVCHSMVFLHGYIVLHKLLLLACRSC